MKKVLLTAMISMIGLTPALAQSTSEGKALAELTFDSIDVKNRGYVDLGDMEVMRGNIFVSMDSDDNSTLSITEMMSWDFGYRNIAQKEGKEEAYNTALRVVYNLWDRNADGTVTDTESRQSLIADFQRADTNGDAVLSEDEFLRGFAVNAAIRSVLKPTK